jgi:RecA/RadA recombinase
MGDKAIVEVETISSGSLGIDLALGVGGYPRGRVIEIYGPESSGKLLDTSCYCRSSKKRVELQLLLMLNMHSIEIMLKN